eukprot:4472076-Amphidinium_carterae.1
MPEDSCRSNSHDWIQGQVLGGMLVYVDDLLVISKRAHMLDLFGQIAKKWATSPAEILGRLESDVDTLRFL